MILTEAEVAAPSADRRGPGPGADGTAAMVTASQRQDTRSGWSIVVPDWCAVTCFLERYPFVRRIVQMAYERIPVYFTRVRVTVEIVEAPAPADGARLSLAIAVAESESVAARTMARLGQDWLWDALERARGKVSVVLLSGADLTVVEPHDWCR